MDEPTLLVVALAVFAYAALAGRLEGTSLTAPVLFLALGAGLQAAGLADYALQAPLDVVGEIALALVLFSDAARTDARALIRAHRWPMRMLSVGLPLAILFGAVVAWALLPGWPIWEAALVAAILAPTDAALGDAVASSPALPERVRRALVVESGLNDGLALPAVLLFATLAEATEAAGASQGLLGWLGFVAAQIGFGALAGLLPGLGGGRALAFALFRGWSGKGGEGIAALAVVAFAYLLAEGIGGNAFVACFCAGLGFGLGLDQGRSPETPRRGGFMAEFLDSEGRILVLGAFLLIGAELLPAAHGLIGWRELALILLSLFVLRPAAIWISLIGTRASPRARLFLGWFGPRGLATALFALVATQEHELTHAPQILALAAASVAISAVLHGVSAAPAARRLGPVLTRELESADERTRRREA